MAQNEWAESYDWKCLYKEDNSVVSTSTGNTSVALPSDFRKLAGQPKITYDGATTRDFSEIKPQQTRQYSSTSRYVYILGNPADNYTMVINAGTLASGASVMVPYYAAAASLASPVNITMCPNPEYLVQRTLAYVWESRGDERFPQAKLEADKQLKRMLEFEQTYGPGYYDRVRTHERTEWNNFRWGK